MYELKIFVTMLVVICSLLAIAIWVKVKNIKLSKKIKSYLAGFVVIIAVLAYLVFCASSIIDTASSNVIIEQVIEL